MYVSIIFLISIHLRSVYRFCCRDWCIDFAIDSAKLDYGKHNNMLLLFVVRAGKRLALKILPLPFSYQIDLKSIPI